MHHIQRFTRIALAGILSTALLGCGGSDEDSADATDKTDPAAKYVGNWSTGCIRTSSVSSFWREGHYERTGDHSLHVSGTTDRYSTPDCSGDARTRNFVADVVIDEQGSWRGHTVDKVTIEVTVNGFSFRYRALFLIRDHHFYGAVELDKRDEHYPADVDESVSSRKQ
ncbi:hypothetical protein [Hydrogenophaga sp. 5NK40-0174]|uniref:hypothetical protein n=1 Tax=Hydrogenophaga sp. 5NK40-0174 TaxID=3127649 RepID=UPI003103056C